MILLNFFCFRFKVYFSDKNFPASSDLLKNVKKVLLCTGSVYYQLIEERISTGREKDVAICRVEQISPFPYDVISKDLAKYVNASIYWVQEEHRNQGWWTYVRPRLIAALKLIKKNDPKNPIHPVVSYIGRCTAYQTATAESSVHEYQRRSFLYEAMSINS